jgi:hypothetical protein
MIAAGDYEPGVRHLSPNQRESLNHKFETFVGAPLAESEEAVRIPAAGEIRILGAASQNAVSAHVDVVAAVLVEKNLAISRHQNRYRVRE